MEGQIAIAADRFTATLVRWRPEKEMRLPRSPERETGPIEESGFVSACRSGDIAAYEELYRLQSPRMKSVAMNIVGNSSDAEDAVQEAFLKIYRGIDNFKGRSSFFTWIYRVLVNTCYDLMRKHQRRPQTADQVEVTDLGLAEPSRDHLLRLALERSLLRLKPRARTAFVLFEVEGFRHREIGEILGVSEGTSKQLVFSSKRKLQGWLRETGSAGQEFSS